jgi:GntR family transcriptional repressor for pyruvate dehydrogenase complex
MGTIEKRKTADFVFEEIKRMISSGEVKPGQKLPDQYTFSSQLGVSRTCLREALSGLTRLGLIEQRPKVGTIVKSQISPYLSEYLTPPLISDQQATTELLEARRYIEIDAVELAVKNATSEELEELDQLIKRMVAAVKTKNIGDYSECDAMLHFSIAKASHNRFIVHTYINLRGIMEQYIRESFVVFPYMLGETMKYHSGIVQAIKARNTKKAKTRMRKHIIQTQKVIEEYYQSLSRKH